MYNPVSKDVKKSKTWEQFFKHEIGMLLDWNILWNPDRFIIDWSVTEKATHPNIKLLVEAKVRKDHSVHKWPDFMIGLRKYQWGVNYYNTTGIPFVIALRMSDGIVTYIHNPKHKHEVKYTGRSKNKRHDDDVIPCIHIKNEKEFVTKYYLSYSLPWDLKEALANKTWPECKEKALQYLNAIYEGKDFINYEG